MARKDLLKGLMGDDEAISAGLETKNASPALVRATPRYTKGAIGAVSQSIAELKSRAIIEIVADQIDPDGVSDRLDDDDAAHQALVASIRDYGQQVPVLVRHDQNVEGRYQIVYGRRRVAALKDLGLPVKAIVRDLTDRDLVIAQGQENTARKDLSFIEKVNFARQMRDDGYDRKIICDALSIDKTVISRMLSIADTIPLDAIIAIGAAPGVGRDRWLSLADSLASAPKDFIKHLQGMEGVKSDKRFETLWQALSKCPAPPAKPKPQTMASHDGTPLGKVSKGTSGLKFTFNAANGFDDWLAEHITEIHRDWKQRGE